MAVSSGGETLYVDHKCFFSSRLGSFLGGGPKISDDRYYFIKGTLLVPADRCFSIFCSRCFPRQKKISINVCYCGPAPRRETPRGCHSRYRCTPGPRDTGTIVGSGRW